MGPLSGPSLEVSSSVGNETIKFLLDHTFTEICLGRPGDLSDTIPSRRFDRL